MKLPEGKIRFQHCYICGMTGVGKSALMLNMIYRDIQDGAGVVVIDPHGTLAQAVLTYIPKWRNKDLIYLNVADIEKPVHMNPLSDISKRHDLIADNLTSNFIHIYGKDAIGPRSQMVLTNSVMAELYTAQPSLLSVLKFVMDKDYRTTVLVKVKDPLLKKWWRWFETRSKSYQDDAVAPIVNKLNGFLMSPVMRNIVSQPSTFEFKEAMDGVRSIVLEDGVVKEKRSSQKIVILNLSKTDIGEQNAYLLGAMTLSRLFHTCFERDTDRPFYVYVDEFQNFASGSIDLFFSEARKTNVGLIVANQYLDQLDKRIQASVFGNVGTIISFKVGPNDAPILNRQLGLKGEDMLLDLEPYHVRMSRSAVAEPTDPPPEGWDTSGIVRYARRFGRDVSKVEHRIKAFLDS